MWLIDTLVAKTSYVSSHIKSCLKLHKSTKGGNPCKFKKRHLKLDIRLSICMDLQHIYIYIMWLGKICPCTRCLDHTLYALILHAYLNRKKKFHCQLILSKSYSKGVTLI